MTASIGSVSVDVVPDARAFWTKFKAQTQAEGRQAGDQVGRQVSAGLGRQGDNAGDEFSRRLRSRMEAALKALPKATIDADSTPAQRQLAQLRANLARLTDKRVLLNLSDTAALATLKGFQAKLEAISRESPDVRLRINADAAQAQLVKLRAELGLLEADAHKAAPAIADIWGPVTKVIGRSDWSAVTEFGKAVDDVGAKDGFLKQQHDAHLLALTLSTLGPSLVPFTAVALAGAGAFGLLGASGALAVLGIKKEMAAGTPVGQQYAADITALKFSLAGLEKSAASGFLGPFNAAVARSQTQLKLLNPEVHDFAAIGGDIGGHVLGGLIGGFHALNPLFSQLAVLADHGAASFDRYANGGGLGKFQAFVQQNLPEAIATLDSVGSAIAHIAASVGPLGGVSLTVLKTFADVINALPPGVITALATAFISLRIASTGLSVLSSVAKNLAAVSTTAKGLGAGGTGLAAGLGLAGGAAVIFTGAMFGLTQIMADNAAKQQYVNQATQAYLKTLQDTHGAVTAATTDAVLQQATSSASLSTLQKLGISTDLWVNAVEHGGKAYSELTVALAKGGAVGQTQTTVLYEQRQAFLAAQKQQKDYTDATTANNKALAQQNPLLAKQADSLGLTVTSLQAAQDARKKQTDADQLKADRQKVEIAQNYQLQGTQAQLAKTFGITTAQVQQYATALGITQDELKGNGVGSALGYANAVDLVAKAYNNADAGGTAFLATEQQFAQSAGSSADRAALIGATLRQASGDALGYAGTLNQAAVAQKTFGEDIKSAAAAVGKNGESTKAYLASIVNLKTGVINYNNAAAAPLIHGLQSIQDAQIAAAQATFQHEVATKGGVVAGADAYNQYVSRTGPQLEDQLTKLGLNKTAAHNLAKEYLGVPADVKTKIEQEGANPVLSVLQSIRGIMLAIAGTKVHPTISVKDSASTQITKIQENLAALKDHTIDITTYVKNVILPTARAQGRDSRIPGGAAGGHAPEGWFTLGEGNPNTWELAHKVGAKLDIYSNRDARKMLPGGPTGQSIPGFASGTTAAQQKSLAAQRANIRFKIDNTDFARLIQAITGSTSSLAAATRTLLADVRTATLKGAGSASLVNTIARENSQLVSESARRAVVANKLKAANSKLAAVQGQYNDEIRTVRSAVLGSFDITTAGQQSGGASSPDSILASLKFRVDQSAKFSSNLKALGKKGLSKTVLQQLAEAGPDQAGTNLSALAGASAAQIRQFDTLYSQLGAAGTSAGKATANSLYGAGVNAAKGLVAGLKSQEKSLDAQMKRLADVMVNQIKKSLKIHSPSQVGHDLGAYFGLGLANGIASHEPTVRRAATSLAAASLPRASVPSIGASGQVPVVYVTAMLDGDVIDHRADVRIEHHSQAETRSLLAGRVP